MLDVQSVDDLQMKVGLGAVARVSATRDGVAGVHLLTDLHPDAAELQQRNCGQRAMGRQQPASRDCGKGKLLAMLDGPVNSALSEFAGADLHYQSLPPAQYQATSSEAAESSRR